MSGNGLERKIRVLEGLRAEEHAVHEPSPEVLAKWRKEDREAFLNLAEVAKRAFEEEGEVVHGAHYDDEGNFQGLEMDAEVDEAYERWLEVGRAARAEGVGLLDLADDDLHFGGEHAEYALKVFQSLRSDSRGNPWKVPASRGKPWQGPFADESKNFRENPPRPRPSRSR